MSNRGAVRALSTFSDPAAEKYLLAVAAYPDGYETILKPLGIVHFEFSNEQARQAWLAIERLAARGDAIHTLSIGREGKFAEDWNIHLFEDLSLPCKYTAEDCRDRIKECHARRREDELTKPREAGEITREQFIEEIAKIESHVREEKPEAKFFYGGRIGYAMQIADDRFIPLPAEGPV